MLRKANKTQNEESSLPPIVRPNQQPKDGASRRDPETLLVPAAKQQSKVNLASKNAQKQFIIKTNPHKTKMHQRVQSVDVEQMNHAQSNLMPQGANFQVEAI